MSMQKLTCAEVQDFLAEIELGFELGSKEAAGLDEHLARCDACRRVHRREQELSSLLEQGIRGLAGAPRDLAERIAGELPERTARKIGSTRFFRLEAAAALVLFGAGLFVGWIVRDGSPGAGPANSPGAEAVDPGGAARTVTPTFVTDGNTAFSQQVSPEDQLRTFGTFRGRIVDPRDPDRFQIEMYVESELESPAVAPDKAARRLEYR